MSESGQKVPAHPPVPLVLEDAHLTQRQVPLWRIHNPAGRHPAAWNSLRTFGPIESMRWDPQPPNGASSTSAHGIEPAVAYTSTTIDGAIAEVFQAERVIALDPDRALTSWIPTRQLVLVDLSESDFGLHNGAAHMLPFVEKKSVTRNWARAIFEQFGDRVDGLLHRSTVAGDEVVTLFTRAADSFPVAPSFSRSLSHVDVAGKALQTARRLQWPVF